MGFSLYWRWNLPSVLVVWIATNTMNIVERTIIFSRQVILSLFLFFQILIESQKQKNYRVNHWTITFLDENLSSAFAFHYQFECNEVSLHRSSPLDVFDSNSRFSLTLNVHTSHSFIVQVFRWKTKNSLEPWQIRWTLKCQWQNENKFQAKIIINQVSR